MKYFKAIVFDMDGLLLDTETIALRAFVEACQEQGLNPDLKVYHRCIGTNYARTREILQEGYGPSFPYDVISRIWNQKFTYRVENLPIPHKEGVVNLLEFLHRHETQPVIVTSTRHSTAIKMLENAGILPYFGFVIGGDQIKNGKPNPEIYRTACQRLGNKPEDCLALEDSENGVRSALAAGLTVIQIPDLVQPTEEVRAFGHLILKSLTDVQKWLADGV
ncbi:MAG TPA: HAD family phosphatase [Dehalococcoidales bacterium]|nr:HAD family phosphatase [Dehalococcoidales bacterium]